MIAEWVMMAPPLGLVEVGTFAIGIGLAYLAGILLKPKNQLIDDKPTTLSRRGAYTPYYRGTRRIAPVFTWVGDRRSSSEAICGGKGSFFGGGQKQTVWYEQGMHVIGVGPVFALHRIMQSGKVIFEGPITSESHPSGSQVDLGQEGSFRIYWGEVDQNGASPDATYSAATGVDSVFPLFCYVVWDDKRLGTTPAWPLIEYVMQARVVTTQLTGSEPYFPPTTVLDGNTNAIIAVTNGVEGTGYFTVSGDQSDDMDPLGVLRLTGNAIADQDLEILNVVVFQYEVRAPLTLHPLDPGLYELRTKMYPVGGLSGADANGDLQTYTINPDDGVNLAHVMDEMLFAGFPYGAKHNPAEFDIDSLEEIGVLMETDDIRGSVLALSGQTIESTMAVMLQDIQTMLSMDVTQGKTKWMPLRVPSGTLNNIPESMILPPLAELEIWRGEMPRDLLIFAFEDRENNFRTMTVAIADDGQAFQLEAERSEEISISSTVNFTTGSEIAERRSQEELGVGPAITIYANRDARSLIPGEAITVFGYDETLRVMGVAPEPLSGKVAVKVMTDFYGVPASTFVNAPGGSSGAITPVEPDLAVGLIEIPEYLIGTRGTMAMMVPRIRASTAISAAGVWFSRDNTTYTFVGLDEFNHTGGALNADLDASGPRHLDSLEITSLGPDMTTALLDLSADEENWRLGRQVMAVNGELMFFRSVTALGGDQWQINDILRARYDTSREDHSTGDNVFLFQEDAALPLEDLLLIPSAFLYAKTEPYAGTSVFSAPVGTYLYGKAIRPMPLGNLRVTAPSLNSPSFETGDDLTFRWGFRSLAGKSAGCGLQGAGVAVAPVTYEGSFQVDLLTTGDVLKASYPTTAQEFDYTNAELVADFGSEPSAFKVQVTAILDGQVSETLELTVTKV